MINHLNVLLIKKRLCLPQSIEASPGYQTLRQVRDGAVQNAVPECVWLCPTELAWALSSCCHCHLCAGHQERALLSWQAWSSAYMCVPGFPWKGSASCRAAMGLGWNKAPCEVRLPAVRVAAGEICLGLRCWGSAGSEQGFVLGRANGLGWSSSQRGRD